MDRETASFFPEITGCEEEVRIALVVNGPKNNNNPSLRHNKILECMDNFCPPLSDTHASSSNVYRENGSLTYIDTNGIELASAEVLSPQEHITYGKANSILLERSLENYLSFESKRSQLPLIAIWQRRVTDQKQKTWGYHDNLSVHRTDDYAELVKDGNSNVSKLWLNFLLSRTFITGAMKITANNMYYSQKLATPFEFSGYGNKNILLRTDETHGQRLEIRCNDINLQDWSALSRIGGAALVLAASQTELSDVIMKRIPELKVKWPVTNFSWNKMGLTKDMKLKKDGNLMQNIDIQRFIFDTILNNLEDYTNQPIPSHYRSIGESMLRYCSDVESVAEGKEDIDILLDRSDWAVKLYAVRKNIQDDPKDRFLGDYKSRFYDMLYDKITINGNPDDSVSTQHGYGYKWSNKNSSVLPNQIEEAIINPPRGSRAQARVQLNKSLGDRVISNDWHCLKIEYGGKPKMIPLSYYKYSQAMIDKLVTRWQPREIKQLIRT